MDDIEKTIAPRRAHESDGSENDFKTIMGARDRKADGRFQVGDLIMNRYKVISELGQGGMGVVYKCFDETAGIEVALKALPPELSHNTLEMEDIKDNFQLVAKLVHQNIAISKNLEKDDLNGNYYLIMECCEGEDLRRWIRRKRKDGNLTLDEVLPIIRQVADALDYAHKQRVMHRDIKPGNIMINSDGDIKVLDFGLAAQIHTSMTRVSMAYHGTSGTGPYMAPEQWRGRAQGAPADQYALAVMTYEMLAGHLPFESTDPAVLQQAVLTQEAEAISGLSPKVWSAINRAMSKEPAERFESCSDFALALSGKKVKAAKKKSVVFPKWLSAVIVLALLVAGGAGYYLFDKQQKEQQRIAEEDAAKKRKIEEQRIAEEEAAKKRKIEEQLDAENSALKVELERKISDIKAKNYDPAHGFGDKIRQMEDFYLQAQESKLFRTANDKYKNSKELADWILLNGEFRKEAQEYQSKIPDKRKEAEQYEPAIYAPEQYEKALEILKDAEKQYRECNFAEAKSKFEKAYNVFSETEKSAYNNKLKFFTASAQKAEKFAKWNELKVWAEKIRPLKDSLADDFKRKAEAGVIKIAVEECLVKARKAKSSEDWQKVYDHSVAALQIDNSCQEAKNLKSEAENNLPPTLTVCAYVNGKVVPAVIKTLKTEPDRQSEPWKLAKGSEYEFEVTYKSGENEYYGKIPAFICAANGPHRKEVTLEKVVFNGTVTLANGVKLEMVKVEPGTFTMSARDGENNKSEVAHTKTLTRPFYIGKYEVTQEQYEAIVGKNPSRFKGAKLPVEQVTWYEAMSFCEQLNQYAPQGWKFTLPTETQWEFAARGGNRSRGYKYSGSNNIDDVAWYDKNSNHKTHKVGGKSPNELGLYDMSGNVWEWCLDNCASKSNESQAEFSRSYSDSDGSRRVSRGGGWLNYARTCRSAVRLPWYPDRRRAYNKGLRVALVRVQ